ncbi:MAG TPA: cytochrome P450 [Chloroflexota bacterium]|nr:cytochrome P450 [Chloroflexota bacterium]
MVSPFDEIPRVAFPDDAYDVGRVSSFLADQAIEQGPIFRWTSPQLGEIVFLVGPEANRFVMHTGREHFSHDKGWTPIVGDWLGKGLLNMDPPEHPIHRRMMNPAFTSAYVARYLPIMHRVIAQRTADWLARGQVDLLEEAREIAFDVAAAALGGLRTGPEVDRMRELFYTLIHGYDPSEEPPEEYQQRYGQAIQDLGRVLLPLLRERQENPNAEPSDVLGMLVAARDDDGQPLSLEQILAHVKILLVAGHETTTTLGSWTLYQLASRPEWKARVLAELAASAPATDVALDFDTLRGLKLLDAFIREVGRLNAPVLMLPRGVVSDFEFGGYAVPAGAKVRLAIGAGHRLARVFANPDAFDPDRFGPERDEDKKTPYGLVTFGGGPRVCIGMSFAQLEVKALVAHVLRACDPRPIPARPPLYTGFLIADTLGGVPVQVHPLPA